MMNTVVALPPSCAKESRAKWNDVENESRLDKFAETDYKIRKGSNVETESWLDHRKRLL